MVHICDLGCGAAKDKAQQKKRDCLFNTRKFHYFYFKDVLIMT